MLVAKKLKKLTFSFNFPLFYVIALNILSAELMQCRNRLELNIESSTLKSYSDELVEAFNKFVIRQQPILHSIKFDLPVVQKILLGSLKLQK